MMYNVEIQCKTKLSMDIEAESEQEAYKIAEMTHDFDYDEIELDEIVVYEDD